MKETTKQPKYYGKKNTTPEQDNWIQDLISKGYNIAGVVNKNDKSAVKNMMGDIKADLTDAEDDGRDREWDEAND